MKTKPEYTYETYIADVLSGSQKTGLYVRQAVERFQALRSDDGIEFREDRVRRVIDFFWLIRHYKGRHAGRRFALRPWQQFILAYVYGLYEKSSGLRLVTNVYLEISRKNGKTAFAAGLCLYHMLKDGENSAECDLAANSKEQASIAYEFCSQFAKGMDSKGKVLEPYRSKIKRVGKTDVINVFASDTTSLDGFNASMYLLDEFHAAKDTKLRDVLDSSQGAREQPMSIIITSAGFDKLGPCYKQREVCTEVLAGVKDDPHLAPFIYSLDEGDDWTDPANWVKSNPNLGVTVYERYLENQVQNAKNDSSKEVGVRTKNLGQWVDSASVWIPDNYILEATAEVDLTQYEGMNAYAGIDLSSTSDLGALSVMIPLDDGKLAFWVRYYLPESALKENRFKELYGDWRRHGWLTVTPGNVTDYDYILNDLCDLNQKLYIQKVAYDSWNSTQFVINATERGLPMEPFSQALGNFNRPTKEMERLLRKGSVVLDNNEINRHCFRNVVLARDRNGNIKPSKQFVEKKIDGVIAMLQALGVWLTTPHYGDLY